MPTVDLTRIGSNIGAMYSLQSLLDINNKLSVSQQRLATGKRLNSAADDPAGLTIATKMKARSEGLSVVGDNISDAKNMLAVAEDGLSKLTDILVQMRSKANQAASDTLGGSERATIQTQLSQYAEQIDDIINETKWNGVKLLDGTVSKRFQTGVDEGEYTDWSLSVKHDPSSLGISTVVANDTANKVAGTGGLAVGSVASGAVFNGLTKLATGTYYAAVKDVAADADTGSISNTTNRLSPGGTTVSVGATAAMAATTDELSNGNGHVLEITGYTTNANSLTVSYKFDNGAEQTISVSSNSAASVVDLDINGNESGVTLTFGAAATSALTGLSGSYTFDYVKAGMAEMEVQYEDGTTVSVDADGSNGATNPTTSTFYVAESSTYQTGRGLDINTGSIAQLLAQANQTGTARTKFTYQAASNYSVDVSSATTAASYMTTVQNALDVVNQSMAELGSLMNRMSIKEDAASSARINVEAAYNRIMNADMAEEQVNASKYLVLQQTAVAMLAQANQAPQFLLSLFQ